MAPNPTSSKSSSALQKSDIEEVAQVTAESFRLLVDSVSDYGIFMLSPAGIINSWNLGAERLKGYAANEVIGKHFSIFYPQADRDRGHPQDELAIAHQKGRYEEEGWRIRKDGTRFWANVVITALYDEGRRLRGYSKVTRDITERKRAEDQLKMANEGMERRVQERTQALTVANEKLVQEVNERKRAELALQQAVRARDEFLSIASHELRTPITPVKLQLQALLAHFRNGTLPNISPDRIEKMVLTVDRSLNRLGKLIDNLLDVARINAGKIELHPEELEVGEVINDTCSRFQQEAVGAGSALVLEPDAAAIMASLDRTRLEQIITNLIVNAIKFGGAKPITVSFARQDSTLVIRISDQGVGIASENFARIFERFEQVDKHYGAGGLGLGLYITKQIVDAQSGTIRVESTLGVGSTFVVELPLA